MRGVTSSVLPEASAMPTQSSCPSEPKASTMAALATTGVTFADGVGPAVRHRVAFKLDPAVLTGVDAVFADDHAVNRPGFVAVCSGFRLIGADQLEVVVGGERRAEWVLFGEVDAVAVFLSTIDASPSGAMPVPWALSKTKQIMPSWRPAVRPDVMACVVLPVMFDTVVVTTLAPSETRPAGCQGAPARKRGHSCNIGRAGSRRRHGPN